jgi:hypothetical protein
MNNASLITSLPEYVELMELQPSALPSKIVARNAANAISAVLLPSLLTFWGRYQGKKIFKADGSLMASVKAEFEIWQSDNIPDTRRINFYRNRRDEYSLSFYLQIDSFYKARGYEARGDTSSNRVEQFLGVGEYERNLNGFGATQVLAKIGTFNHGEFDKRYNAETIVAARKRVEAAKKELSQAESELGGFGTYDV